MNAARTTWSKLVRFRGDTTRLPFRLTDELSAPYNPTGKVLLFTVKDDLSKPDSAALIQKISPVGGFYTIDAVSGQIEVELVPDDYAALIVDTIYQCDVQGQDIASGAVKTVGRATLEIIEDVTQGTTLAIPTFTTSPAPSADLGLAVADRRIAAEDLASGSFVSMTAAGLVRADSAGLPAHGFVRAATLAGAVAALCTLGALNGLSGLMPGATYWLGSNGLSSPTPPLTGLVQSLGVATAPDTLLVSLTAPLVAV